MYVHAFFNSLSARDAGWASLSMETSCLLQHAVCFLFRIFTNTFHKLA